MSALRRGLGSVSWARLASLAVSEAASPDHPSAIGAVLCLVSAAGFGAMAIFGKLAYEAEVSTLTLLLVRFVLAGSLFGALIALRPALRPSGIARRSILVGLALGGIGYALQAGLFFAALHRVDASLLALLLYTYPAWVTLSAFALGRERPDRRRLVALGLSSCGLVIVLAFAAGGEVDAIGVAMGIGAAITYTAYILVADSAGVTLPPLTLSALVCAGAIVTFAIVGIAAGAIDLGFESEGWLWLGLIALVSTALPITTFFAGMARVGPSTASILSTFEPVVTVSLAYLAFSERLSAVQLAGAALVLAAAVLLAAPARGPATAPPT
jgi:drug/metabolite transporter (DMT)-like permease